MPENVVSVVLVTNAGQGYGRAIALAYGLADYDVICADKDVGLASKTAAEIEELAGNAIPVQANISVQADIQKVFERAYDIFGDLSGIVHVTSFDNPNPFERLSEGEFNDLWVENLKSTFLLLRQTQRYLSKGWFVLVAPPYQHDALHIEAIRGALGNLINQAEKSYPHLNSNMVIPSRQAADPYHDDALVESVLFLGTDAHGISGQRLYIDLPPPPKIIESLLPEVRAALDSSLRQEELGDNELGNELGLVSNSHHYQKEKVTKLGYAARHNTAEAIFNENHLEPEEIYADDYQEDYDATSWDEGEEEYDSLLVMNMEKDYAKQAPAHAWYDEQEGDWQERDWQDDVWQSDDLWYQEDGYQEDGYQEDGYQEDGYQEDGYQEDEENAVASWQEEVQLAEAMKPHALLDNSQLEPLNFENTAAQLEAALADDPDTHWYCKERQHNSPPASRAARKYRHKA